MSGIDRLADCGRRPNCISSTASNERRRLGPWPLALAAGDAWPRIERAVTALPRTRIVTSEDGYLHAESRTRWCRFVDDLEVVLDAEQGVVGVRSASRIGYSDRGVNRRRVRALLAELVERGVVAG